MAQLSIPENLAAACRDPEQIAWLSGLPTVLGELCDRWSLTGLGEPFRPGGVTAWVAPVRDRHGAASVLKVVSRHDEAEDEAAGLREWDGDGAVALIDSVVVDDLTAALLLERCDPGTSLAEAPVHERDRVIATLLPRLWRTGPFTHEFRPLSQMCADWVTGFRQRNPDPYPQIPLDPGLIRAGLELFTELPRNAAQTVLLATDLHADNVLTGEREPWLAIDPKPYVGDPTYDVLQYMLDASERLLTEPHHFSHRLAASCDLDPERLQRWLFARCVIASEDWPELAQVAEQMAPG